MYTIRFWKNEGGRSPVEEFILKLNARDRARISMLVMLLQEYGSNLMMPYSKALGGGLFELRAKTDKGIRIIYIFEVGEIAVLVHAFFKKTQKTPPKEIRTARDRVKSLKY